MDGEQKEYVIQRLKGNGISVKEGKREPNDRKWSGFIGGKISNRRGVEWYGR